MIIYLLLNYCYDSRVATLGVCHSLLPSLTIAVPVTVVIICFRKEQLTAVSFVSSLLPSPLPLIFHPLTITDPLTITATIE